MLTSISWQQYLQAILIVSIIYYLVILMLYYRRDIRHWLANFPNRRSRLRKFISSRTETSDSGDSGDSDEPEAISAEGNPINNPDTDTVTGEKKGQQITPE